MRAGIIVNVTPEDRRREAREANVRVAPLVAEPLVTAGPEIGQPFLGVIPNIPGLKKRLRAKRKLTAKSAIKKVEAAGFDVKGVKISPDGSITVEVGKAEGEQGDGQHAEANPWHTV